MNIATTFPSVSALHFLTAEGHKTKVTALNCNTTDLVIVAAPARIMQVGSLYDAEWVSLMAMPDPADATKSLWQIPGRIRLELLAALSTDPDKQMQMTYAEFLEWADEDTLAEWVDGKVLMTSPASARHQYLVIFLSTLLSTYAGLHDLGTVLTGPFQMKLARSGREPDVLFLATEHLPRLRPTRLEGPADLVVEIVSDESVARDRGEKFEEYREAGIPEYWLLDPRIEQAEFYQLDDRGRYQPAAIDSDGTYRSRVLPGFWLRVDWLWQQPLPTPTAILLEIDPDTFARHLQEQLRKTP